MSTSYRFTDGKFQAISSSGPVALGKLYTWAAGGLVTPLATYTDQAGGTANANPVVLDAEGRANVWLGPNAYRMVLTTAAGVTIWDVDNIVDNLGTLALSSGSSLIGFLQVGTGAVARTAQAKMRDIVSVFDFMTAAEIADVQARTNTLDVTASVLAAIAANGANKALRFPAGSYKITSTLVMSTDRTKWIGDGSVATQLLFAPTAADTCIEFGTSAADVVRSEFHGFGFYSNDSTYKKIALDVIRTSQCLFSDISINGSVVVGSTGFWSGANSVGIRTRGHELTSFRDIFSCADLPIQISDAPSLSIDIDHFNFHNLYLLANGNPNVTIDTGINLTNVSFTGYQAWVLGTAGLYWVDTTTTGASSMLVLENIRWEQGTNAASYSVDIEHNYGLQGLSLKNCYGGTDRKGVKLRKVENVHLDTHWHAGATEALNVDATVKRIKIDNAFWQAGSTATMTGQRLVYGAPLNPNSGALPPFAYYDESTNTLRTSAIGGPLMETSFTVADNGTQDLGGIAMQGMLFITESEGLSAQFYLKGTYGSTSEVSDPSGAFSITVTTASSTNIYWNAGTSTYRLENKRGASRTYRVLLVGSYIAL